MSWDDFRCKLVTYKSNRIEPMFCQALLTHRENRTPCSPLVLSSHTHNTLQWFHGKNTPEWRLLITDLFGKSLLSVMTRRGRSSPRCKWEYKWFTLSLCFTVCTFFHLWSANISDPNPTERWWWNKQPLNTPDSLKSMSLIYFVSWSFYFVSGLSQFVWKKEIL